MAGDAGSATAVAVTDAEAGDGVSVTDFEGVLDCDLGTVTIVPVPSVQNGGSEAIDPDRLVETVETHDLLAVVGTEALAAVRTLEVEPDVRFGTPTAVREAAAKGIDVALVAVASAIPTHTDALRELSIGCNVLDRRDGA
jgi:putative transcriptional regulator